VSNIPDAHIGGRLQYFVENWKKITSDKSILEAITGLCIKFDDNVSLYHCRPLRFSDNEKMIVKAEIEKLIGKKVITESVHQEGEVISNVFLRPKKDGIKYRMILNLKPLNRSVEYLHFKMDNFETAKCLMTQNCYMASVDLSDAYFSVPLDVGNRKFVKFEFEGILYEFHAMPQGLSCAPRIFTKILKPVYAKLREEGHNCMGYIDDSLIIGSSFEECRKSVHRVAQMFRELGFVVNDEKSVFVPVQDLVFLGYKLNSSSMTVSLPQDKIQNIVNMCKYVCDRKCVSLREIAKLVGVMTAYCNAVEFGRLHYRNLEILKSSKLHLHKGNFDQKVELNETAIADCHWWIANAGKTVRRIDHGNPDVVIHTDASSGGARESGGWGAIRDKLSAGGRWSYEESQSHINVLELKAVYLGLQSLCSSETGVHILVRSDNTCAISYVNNMGGCRSPECNAIAQSIWSWAIERNIWISASYIPGKENVADEKSRVFHDETEWKLNEEVFHSIVDKWGMPVIDMFASRLNYQIDKYVSWGPDPKAFQIDAFSLNWSDLFIYVYPPFSLLPRVLRKIQKDNAKAIVIAPNWKTQPWYTSLMDLLVDSPLVLPGMDRLMYLPYAPQRRHPLKLRLIACLVSGNPSEHKVFLMKQSRLCSTLGGGALRNSTGATSNDGFCIVNKGTLIYFNRL